MASVARRPIVLIVLHQEHSTPGRVGLALKATGVRLDIRRPCLGEPLPRRSPTTTGPSCSAARCAPTIPPNGSGARSTGSPSRSPRRSLCSASASARRCSRANSAPACSAIRTIAARSGISRSDRPTPATNSAPSPSRAASISGIRTDSTCPPAPNCSPPADRISPIRPIDIGNHAMALQFHPEVTYHMMCRWTLRGAERLTRPGAQQRPGHLGGWFQHDGRVAAWLAAFMPAWLEGRLGETAAASSAA